MTNDDFRQKFEQHRKEIAVTDDTNASDKPMTRAELYGRKETSAKKKQTSRTTKQKSRPKGSTLINTLLILFMLIPISLFIYVYKFYDPMESGNAAELEENIEIDTSIAGEDKEPPEDGGTTTTGDEQKAEEQAEEQKREEEQQRLEEQKKLEEQKRLEEQKKQEEQKRQEAQQRLEEQKRKEAARLAEQKQQEEQQRQEQEQQPKGGSHTVKPGETLYRISVIHYGSGDGVEKIKRANGLSSNEISVGQTIVIP